MIKEKYIPHLAIGAMLIMVGLVAIGSVFNLKSDSSNTEIEQPEYMSKIFDKDKVLQINIQIDKKDWEALKQNATAEKYYPANITINDATYDNVGIRAKGNSSLSMVASNSETDRYSFKIKVDEYQEQNIYGLDKFVLNNMIGDATYMKEYLSYDMFKEMGIATPGYAFANISLNGEPWGVYLAVETLEESFVERNFGNLDGNLYKVESMGGGNKGMGQPPEMPNGEQGGEQPPEMPNGEQGGEQPPEMPNGEQGGEQPPQMPNKTQETTTGKAEGTLPKEDSDAQVQQGQKMNPGDRKGPGGMGSAGGANLVYTDDEMSSYSSIFDYTIFKTTTKKDYKTMIKILKDLNEGNNLEQSIDVEEVLKYFAINTFLVNLDSYAGNMKHNFYLYEEDGKLQILPWDFNLAFGAFESTHANEVINFPIDKPVTDTMENSPLIAKLLEVDEYKEMYHSYLQELIEVYMTSGKYKQTIENLDLLIGSYVKKDATAFYTYDEYVKAIKELKQYGTDRTTSILAQIAGQQPSEEYGTVETNIDLMAMGQQNGGKGGGPGNGPRGNKDLEEKRQEGQMDAEGNNQQWGRHQGNELMQAPFDQEMGQHKQPGAQQEAMSKEDKVIGAICGVLLLGGLIFVLKFKRRR